jgi:hypothetical protein
MISAGTRRLRSPGKDKLQPKRILSDVPSIRPKLSIPATPFAGKYVPASTGFFDKVKPFPNAIGTDPTITLKHLNCNYFLNDTPPTLGEIKQHAL